MKKIIIAGAGHGGLVAAALLAQKGFKVTVYEKKAKGNVGHDFTDVFGGQPLRDLGIELPRDIKYYHNHPMAFYGPSQKTKIEDRSVSNGLNLDRMALVAVLIDFAEKNGAKIVYDTEVLSPILDGSSVIGMVVRSGGKIKAVTGDLVVDSLGCDSPLRLGMPASADIEGDFGYAERFYAYRAFYEKTGEDSTEFHENHFYHIGDPGLAWFMDYDGYCDVLVGSFLPLDMERVEEHLASFRVTYPELGEKLLRGGQFASIPIRKPIGRFTLNGYAAIGDSAAMTIPLIGSGIDNSMEAGRILADVLIASRGDCTVAGLWRYQALYFKRVGAKMAKTDKLRETFEIFTPDDVDFLLDNGILTSEDISSATGEGGMKMNASTLAGKAYRGKANLPLLGKVAMKTRQGAVMETHARNIPEIYNETAAENWIKKYRSL